MNGVEILTVNEVATSFSFNFLAAFIAGGIIIFIFLIPAIKDFRWSSFFTIFSSGCIFGVLVGGLFGSLLMEPVEFETQYKVTISDEVKLQEFYDKYEILEVDGKIYTIKER